MEELQATLYLILGFVLAILSKAYHLHLQTGDSVMSCFVFIMDEIFNKLFRR